METFTWLSTERMTVGVSCTDGIITNTPPIVRKFVGQSIKNLINWMSRQPGFKMQKIITGEKDEDRHY